LTQNGRQKNFISKILKDTAIKTAFRTNNYSQRLQDIEKKVKQYIWKQQCRMECLECSFSYIGLKRKLFQTELKEYLHAMKYNKHTSRFGTHILNTGHIYGDTKTQLKYCNV
jgi:hypothetical protein